MRPTKPLLILLLFLILPCLGYAADLGGLYLRIVEGGVQIRTEETDGWLAAAINTPLREKDRLWVPENGRAEIILHDGTAVRLDRNTSFEVMTTDKNAYRFFLEEGRLYANRGEAPKQALLVETPSTSVRAYGRAKFKVDVSVLGDTDLSVLRGDVRVERPSGEMQVNAGERLVQRRDTPSVEMSRVGPADQWDAWNSKLDNDWERPVDPRVADALPEELRPYGRDLSSNGRWVSTADYGYVWVPTVAVAADWVPYRIGRWVWLGGTYVWLSYEPWGWVPYHYGRWTHVVSFGWCWVPPARRSVYWGPGYVGWVSTPRYVAWVPLAPREIYYGHGYYGPYSARLSGGVVPGAAGKYAYRYASLSKGVTVVHRESFQTGRPAMAKGTDNPFLQENRTMGPPAFMPRKAGFSPLPKVIPEGHIPPARIQARETKPLRMETKVTARVPGFQEGKADRKGRVTAALLPQAAPSSPFSRLPDRPKLSSHRPQGVTGGTSRFQRTTPIASPLPSSTPEISSRPATSPNRVATPAPSPAPEKTARHTLTPPAPAASRSLHRDTSDRGRPERTDADRERSEGGPSMGVSRPGERPPAASQGEAGFSMGGRRGPAGLSQVGNRGTTGFPHGGGRPLSGQRSR